MAAHRTSVRISVGLATALGLLVFFPPRAFAAETARSIGSLTPDQRNHLPDNTQVTLPPRGTVTLGTLRAEHRARMERFSRADLWGKRVAERMPKPTPLPDLSAAHGAGPGASSGSQTGVKQNSSTLPQQPSGRSGQPQQKQGGAVVFSKSNGTGGNAATGLNAAAKAITAVQSTVIPRQTYNRPIPKDYTAFCDAAQASACIYLPPNTTFATESYNVADPTPIVVSDVDPLITDPAACASLGGSLDGMQECIFWYFVVQTTFFKVPKGSILWSDQCAPPSSYRSSNLGVAWTVSAIAGVHAPYTTGATPLTCVAQAWISQ